MKKHKVGIIGTGNIGTDLLMKICKSNYLTCTLFMGRREDSPGIQIAKEMGIATSTKSIEALAENPEICDIVFDATTAGSHKENSVILEKLNKFTIDLTPAKIGKMCVPTINLDECLDLGNVNMVTCAGQATIPLIYAVGQVQKEIEYVEVIASIASKSAGMGTRNNIDEFTQTTKDAIIAFGGIKKAKSMITLNPGEPPKNMHNTIYMRMKEPDIERIRESVQVMVNKLKKFIPGYKIILEPTLENERLTIIMQVEGKEDYLPSYAGNLDIITCAAVEVAEQYAIRKWGKTNENGY